MIEAKIHFTHAIQDLQEYANENEFMISRVFFDLEVDTRWFRGLSVNLKQVVGSSFDNGAVEVSAPTGYSGPMNQSAFQDVVREYYLTTLGLKGGAFNFGPGSRNIHMRNNIVTRAFTTSFEIDEPSGGW